MVREVGRDKARDLATAHEQVIGNFQADEAMDLWNNLQGREIASSNPAASDAELLQLAVSAVEAGQMVVVRDVGSLAWSSSSVGTPLFRPDTPPGAVHDEYGTPYGPVLG